MEEWVKCPFFVEEFGLTLKCENVLNPKYAKETVFDSYQEKKQFMKSLCNTEHPEEVCPYAQRLLEKYNQGWKFLGGNENDSKGKEGNQ